VAHSLKGMIKLIFLSSLVQKHNRRLHYRKDSQNFLTKCVGYSPSTKCNYVNYVELGPLSEISLIYIISDVV
jgi:hypothetical protein